MVTFDDAASMLDEIVDELPEEIFKDLNGGVYLLPDVKKHQKSRKHQPLYILGEYISRYDLGKLIYLYYGSFIKVYPDLPPSELRPILERVLIHELTHHFEFFAGERGLEIKDEIEMNRYLRS